MNRRGDASLRCRCGGPRTRVRLSRAVPAAALAAALSLSLGGCPFIGDDVDLKQQIQGDVAVANAEQVTITIQPENDAMGVTSPYGASTVKVGVAFSLSMSVASDYAFVRWEQTGGSGEVSFLDAASAVTKATVSRAAAGIVIQARCDARPQILLKDPNGAENVLRNRKIIIAFSEAVDPTTVDAAAIQVQQQYRDLASPAASITDKLQYSVSGSRVEVSLKPGEQYDAQNYIWVKALKSIRDLQGNQMKDDVSWYFITGNVLDSTPPVLNSIALSPGAATNTRSITITVSAVDDSGSVEKIRIRETDTGTTETQTTADLYFSSATPYPYTLVTAGEGPKQVEAWVLDPVGQVSNARSAATVLDTVPPTLSTFTMDAGAAYTSSRTVTLSAEDGADTGSGVAYYLAREGSTAPLAGDPGWAAWGGAHTATIASANDGVKTVYLWVKDAAGNVSAGTVSAVIMLDTTPPAAPTGVADQDSVGPVISAAEAAAGVKIRVSYGTSGDTGAKSGDEVELLLGGSPFGSAVKQTLGAGDITNGYVDVTIPSGRLGSDGLKVISARIKDGVGNAGGAGSASVSLTLDTAGPLITSVVFSDATGNPAPFTDLTYEIKNGFAFVTFDEAVYGSASQDPLGAAALTLTVSSGSGVLDHWGVSVGPTANTAVVSITWTTPPATGDSISVEPASAASVYDATGNASAPAASGGSGSAKYLLAAGLKAGFVQADRSSAAGAGGSLWTGGMSASAPARDAASVLPVTRGAPASAASAPAGGRQASTDAAGTVQIVSVSPGALRRALPASPSGRAARMPAAPAAVESRAAAPAASAPTGMGEEPAGQGLFTAQEISAPRAAEAGPVQSAAERGGPGAAFLTVMILAAVGLAAAGILAARRRLWSGPRRQ
jgi:hypothetical protein